MTEKSLNGYAILLHDGDYIVQDLGDHGHAEEYVGEHIITFREQKEAEMLIPILKSLDSPAAIFLLFEFLKKVM